MMEMNSPDSSSSGAYQNVYRECIISARSGRRFILYRLESWVLPTTPPMTPTTKSTKNLTAVPLLALKKGTKGKGAAAVTPSRVSK